MGPRPLEKEEFNSRSCLTSRSTSASLGKHLPSCLGMESIQCRSFSRGPREVVTLVRMLQLGATRKMSSRSSGRASNHDELAVLYQPNISSDETHLCLGSDIACFVILIGNKLFML